MSDTRVDRRRQQRRRAILLLLWWTLLGQCAAGHRPYEKGERPRYPRQHDRWIQRIQRIQYPSLHHRGGYPLGSDQRLQYPSVHDRGQTVQYPSFGDAGSQIQKCAPGYYRDGGGLYLGRCVPCSCNGLASECEERTGRCLNCQYNTAGDRCERCREGYYGNPAQKTCRVCPCPSSVPGNSFAVGCREVSGWLQCICRTGYTGDRCERCAPGFYGDPLSARSCRPCECNGNGNSCDPRTGVCNTLEPKDTNTDEQCQECDSCAQTLLADLERLDDELGRIKTQLDNATASASSRERLQKLEKAISDTKILVNTFSFTINNQEHKVIQLEQDTVSLSDDINSLKNKADERAADANKAVDHVEKTHRRAKDLESEVRYMLKKILALLAQLNDEDNSGYGGIFPSEELAKMLEEAQRIVMEMEGRNFNPQRTAAEKERDEAKKLLEYIKANVSKQCDKNEAAAGRIRDLLKDYKLKLMDLDEALKEAGVMVKQANTQNGLNSQALQDLLNRIEDLKMERKTVQDQVKMAEDELRKTEDLLKMLSDSKKEYEQLAAQLDGARTDLIKKVNDLSQAAAKEDLVRRAEEHAENLNKLAMELQDAVRDSSGRSDVREAMDAIEAYKNITDAIRAAEAAANEAKDAADKALKDVKREDLSKRAKSLKESGKTLLKDAADAEKELQEAAADLTAQKKRLKNADKKKNILEKDLLDAQTELNNINRDDISGMIDEAKRKASSANDSASSTMNKLNAIKAEIDTINVTPLDSNLSSVMDEVDKSVKNLVDAIPSLEDKISEVELLSSQLSPVSNISENIKKIKELIEQAREAANRVVVPMKFTGEGHVEMRPPKDLEDLKAYTALSLSLQRPAVPLRGDGSRRRRQGADKGDMFVFYLGNKDSSQDYIGMALRKYVLYCVYKLNGVEYEIKSGTITGSADETALFDKVDLNRIYQDAEVIFTKLYTSTKPDEPSTSTKEGQETKNLLELSPSDVVFYVGGYPTDFTPPPSLNYPMYKGCLEFTLFNERFISLYNFQNAVNVNLETPCKRYRPPMDFEYFEGTGYAKVVLGKATSTLQMFQIISTHSENGLLFYIGNEDKYYTVTIERGFVVLHSNLLAAPVRSETKVFPVKEGLAEVLIIIEPYRTKEIKVRVSGAEVVKANVDYTSGDFMDYYIGGAPQDLREKNNITTIPLKACVRNVKLNKNFKVFDEKVGVSSGCPNNFLAARTAEFSLGSSLSADLSGFSLADDVTVSLGFKSTENDGLLLQNKQAATGIELALVNGHVVLKFKDKVLKSNKKYRDGKWHYLTVTKRAERIELHIDDEDEGQQQSSSTAIDNTGGSVILGKDTFKGCLSNLYTRRPENLYRAEDLSQFDSTGNVLVDICTAVRPPQLMLDRNSKRDGVMEALNDSLSECTLPALVQHAYRIGGAVSSLSYSLAPQALQPKPHFSLDVRTRSPEGLLFFAATRGGRSHLALYMSKGRIRLSVGKQKEIFNREKYNDGKWHSVIFSLERKKFRLVVDGIRAQDGQLTNDEVASMEFTSPLYLGSTPESLHKELKWKTLPKHSVSGCVRGFKMNGTPMSEPTTIRGAGPCFEGPTQSGAYFSGKGAYVLINESSVVGSSVELLFDIRPRSLTGVLLHVGHSSRTRPGHTADRYLSIYMLGGEVVARVNNGEGEFMVSVLPKTALCDGMFHKISVIKRKNVVQLHVDTVGNYKIGPPSPSTTLTKDPLYVGGIPEPSTHHLTLPVTSSFVGCIQDMRINGDPVSFERLPGAFGPVNLRECPAG